MRAADRGLRGDTRIEWHHGERRALDEDVHLVVLDRMVSERDALDLLLVVRYLKPKLPIIVLSWRAEVGDRVAALDAGATDTSQWRAAGLTVGRQSDPPACLGRGLGRSRGVGYLRGVLRMTPWRRQALMAPLGRGGWAAVADPSAARVGATGPGADRLGEITHLMVVPALRGRGAGRALVEEACRHGERVDVDRMVVVTPPGWAPSGSTRVLAGSAAAR
jgi:ribosomal protein S18 acetylase RimI-like enzyme